MNRCPLEERRAILALWPYLLVVALGAFVLLPRLGGFGFWDPWEPKYAQAAREMLERRSFVVPYFLDEVRLTKPILTYWGVLAGYSVVGVNELGARLVGALMAIASMVGVLYSVWCMRGRSAGLVSACVLGTTPQFLFLSRQATPDVYLFTSFGCGLLFFALGMFGPSRGRTLHFAIAAVGLALAVLAKGPVIVGVIFGATLVVYGALRPEVRDLWRRETRRATVRTALGLLVVFVTLGVLGSLAFLFGTSPEWWGYSDQGRESVAAFRDQILAVAAKTVIAGDPRSILVGSLVGMVLAAWAGFRISTRFLERASFWPELRPFGRPLLLFLGIFIAVAAPWHVAIVADQHEGYFTDFIIKHNLQRVGENVSGTGDSGSYLAVLLYGHFPWSCLIPIGIACLIRWWTSDRLRSHGFEMFLLIAALVTLVAFSGSATRFPHYLAPLLIPLAVLLGLTLDAVLDRKWPARTWTWVATAAALVPPILALTRRDGIEHLVASFTVKQSVRSDVAPGLWFALMLWTIAGFWVLSIMLRSRWLGAALLTVSALACVCLTTVFIPELSRDKSVRALCSVWMEQDEPKEPLCLFGDVKYGVYFYADRQVRWIYDQEEFLEFMRPERPAMCVVQRNRMSRGRRTYLTTYPGHDLHVVERSHRGYVTLANRPFEP